MSDEEIWTGPKRKNRPKLSIDEVVEVRKRYRKGERQVDLAAEFGITKQSVWSIVHYRVHLDL